MAKIWITQFVKHLNMLERKTKEQEWEQYIKNHMQKLIPDYIFAKLEIYICGLITIRPWFCRSWQFGSEFLIISLWKLKSGMQKSKLKYKSVFWYPLKRIDILRMQMQLQNMEQQNQLWWWWVWVGANLGSSNQGQKEQDSWCLTTLVLSNEVTHSPCCAS